jgi:hypothetical protein
MFVHCGICVSKMNKQNLLVVLISHTLPNLINCKIFPLCKEYSLTATCLFSHSVFTCLHSFTSHNHTYECTQLFNNRKGSCSFWFRSKKDILHPACSSWLYKFIYASIPYHYTVEFLSHILHHQAFVILSVLSSLSSSANNTGSCDFFG